MEQAVLVPARCSSCGEGFDVQYDALYENDFLVLRALRARQIQLPLVCDLCV
jgi:hypothetical protein